MDNSDLPTYRAVATWVNIIGATAYVTRGTRQLQLWGSLGPSTFGHLQLLQLTVVFAGHCEKQTTPPC